MKSFEAEKKLNSQIKKVIENHFNSNNFIDLTKHLP
jgi:hypothetical protein